MKAKIYLVGLIYEDAARSKTFLYGSHNNALRAFDAFHCLREELGLKDVKIKVVILDDIEPFV